MSDNGQTFCLYCQKRFTTPTRLRRHIEVEHRDTYAFCNINLDVAKQKCAHRSHP